MRIKMRRTQRGSEDGFTVREYAEGKEYDLAPTDRGAELGRVFLREGWADEVKPAPAPAPAPPPAPPAPPAAPAGAAPDSTASRGNRR